MSQVNPTTPLTESITPVKTKSSLLKRILSAAVLIPVVLGIVQYGSMELFSIFVLALVLVGWWEYARMIRRMGVSGSPILGGILCAALTACFYWNAHYLVWLATAPVSIFMATVLAKRELRASLDHVAYTFLGVVYVSGLMSFLILLRAQEPGATLIYFLFVVIWLTDTGAFVAGKTMGKSPLAPKISPGKTVEGAIGGVVGSLAGGLVAHLTFWQNLPLNHCLIMALFCGIISQFGDLTESMFKRSAGVKDSGSLIPGHGGVLDRLDSLMFAGPALFCYQQLFLNSPPA